MSAPPPSEQLDRNMKLAIQAVHVVRGVAPMSGNYAHTSSPIKSENKKTIHINEPKDLKDEKKAKADEKKQTPVYAARGELIELGREKIWDKSAYWEPGAKTPGWSEIGWWKFARAVSSTCLEMKAG